MGSQQPPISSDAHIWGDGSTSPPVNDEPPAYSGTDEEHATTSAAPDLPPRRSQGTFANLVPEYNPLRSLAEMAKIPHHRYDLGESAISDDKTTITITQPNLFSNARALLAFILDQAALPPKPMLRITGTHEYSVSTRTDFDIRLNLMHLLDWSDHQTNVRSAQYAPIRGDEKSVGGSGRLASESTIATSVKQFCADKAENKSYTLTRRIGDMPVEILEGQIRSLIAALKYRGKVNVVFVEERSRIVVHKQQGWLFNMLKMYPEKKYAAVETVWNLAPAGGRDTSMPFDVAANAARVAKDWWQCWAPAIRNAVLQRKQGFVGVEDWIEMRMGTHAKPPLLEWGQDNM